MTVPFSANKAQKAFATSALRMRQVHCFFSPVSWLVSQRGSALQIHDLKIAEQSCSVSHVQKATENISNYSIQHLHNLLLPPTCRNFFCKALNPREV